jgi:hypothetical protein
MNEAAAGRVVTRSGEGETGVLRERSDGLDQALAEGGFADDQAAIVILHGAGNDFGSGGGIVVDDDDQRHGHALITAHGIERAVGGVAAVIGNDELALLEEHIADGDGFVEQAAGVAAEVEDQAVEIGGAELFEGFGDFPVGGLVELRETDIADAGLEHEGDIDGVARDFVAGNGEGKGIGVAFAGDENLDDGALGTLEHVGDFAGGQAVCGLVVHLNNDVSRAEASVIGRCANVGSYDNGVGVPGGDDHADAVILAALVFTEKGELAGIKEVGVRVEHAEHAGDGPLVNGLIDVHGFRIIGLNDIQNLGEVAYCILVLVGGVGCGLYGRAIDAAEDSRENENRDHQEQATTFWIHGLPHYSSKNRV